MAKNKVHLLGEAPKHFLENKFYRNWKHAVCTQAQGPDYNTKIVFTNDLARVTCQQCIAVLFSTGKIKVVWA